MAADDRYAFLSATQRKTAKEAFDRGVDCILTCQIKGDRKLTAWCAQHDELNYSPMPGRAFEPVSINGSESVGIVRLLTSLENPGTDVVDAIESAMAWFELATREP